MPTHSRTLSHVRAQLPHIPKRRLAVVAPLLLLSITLGLVLLRGPYAVHLHGNGLSSSLVEANEMNGLVVARRAEVPAGGIGRTGTEESPRRKGEKYRIKWGNLDSDSALGIEDDDEEGDRRDLTKEDVSAYESETSSTLDHAFKATVHHSRTRKYANRLGSNLASLLGYNALRQQSHSTTTAASVDLPAHTYLPSGLLTIDPSGRHPIYDLTHSARQRWESMLAGQSGTLEQAVKEYRRRYGRAPPKGFEGWWEYARENGVQLVDEYDQIYHDVNPFHGMKPKQLLALQTKWESMPGTYVLECNSASRPGCHLIRTAFFKNDEEHTVGHERAEGQLELLAPISDHLPHVRLTFSADDGPSQMIGHDFRSSLEEAASLGEHVDAEEHEHDLAHTGWASACAPHQALRSDHDPTVLPDMGTFFSKAKSFIWDHTAAMDACVHPYLTHLTGFLAGHGKGPAPSTHLYPILTMSTTNLHSDVLSVAMEAFTEDVGPDPVWEDKSDERMLWRGSTTGIMFQDDNLWNISQRIRLVEQASLRSGFVPTLHPAPSHEPVGDPELIPVGPMNDMFLDVAFTGKPIQCGSQDVCDLVAEKFEFRQRKGADSANAYKYVFDIDGNNWSARFKRLMTTNSLILKSTIFPEWYSDRIIPWVHYVPVKADLTDLYDILTFFRGSDARGTNGHDEMAKEIAMEGKKWSQTFWRKEDMIAYQYRLVLELARVMSPDRQLMDYVVPQ